MTKTNKKVTIQIEEYKVGLDVAIFVSKVHTKCHEIKFYWCTCVTLMYFMACFISKIRHKDFRLSVGPSVHHSQTTPPRF